MALPDQNPIYTKIDGEKFYLSTTSSTLFDATQIKTEIAYLQGRVDYLVGLLQGASAQGVTAADDTLAAVQGQPLSSKLAGVDSIETNIAKG